MRMAWTTAAAVALLVSTEATAGRTLGSLVFEPCTLSAAGSPEAHEAQCTSMKVPEDRAQPAGRSIELRIAWIPASGQAEADPVFFLAGGPGQAATEAWPQVAHAFDDVVTSRDVILVDQRGTGSSNPLHCKTEDDETASDPDAEALRAIAEAQARRCLDELSKHADLRFYTTTDAVADLDAVRKAVGAAQVNVVGVSYGTRVAQQFAKTFPKHTRTVVLDSPVSTRMVLGSEHARNIEDALQAQFARCAADPGCSTKMGDLAAQLKAVRQTLAAGDQPAVRFRDSVSGEWQSEVPRIGYLALLLRMYSYQASMAAMMPLLIHQAAEGDWVPLLAQAHSYGRSLSGQLAHGMELSVLCAEDADELEVNPADAETLLGTGFVDYIKAQCAIWPRGQRPADFREPLRGEVPVLILSGELDPVTPPRYGAAIAAELPNSAHYTLKGQGHSQLALGCVPKLFAQFLERASVKALKAECLDRIKPAAPFSGLYGWDP